MNVFAKFDEISSMTLQDIKETKRHGHTFVRSFVGTDNVKTVYPPTNTVCRGYNKSSPSMNQSASRSVTSMSLCKSMIVTDVEDQTCPFASLALL